MNLHSFNELQRPNTSSNLNFLCQIKKNITNKTVLDKRGGKTTTLPHFMNGFQKTSPTFCQKRSRKHNSKNEPPLLAYKEEGIGFISVIGKRTRRPRTPTSSETRKRLDPPLNSLPRAHTTPSKRPLSPHN